MENNEPEIFIITRIHTISGEPVAEIIRIGPDGKRADALRDIVYAIEADAAPETRQSGDRLNTAAILALLYDPVLHEEFKEHCNNEKNALTQAIREAYLDPRAFEAFQPKERWRSKRPDESARDFMERTYLKLPYEKRPYMHQLANQEHGDRPLFDVLYMMAHNNRRTGRVGEAGSLDAAHKLSDLFPMMGSVRKPAARNAPDGPR